MQGLKSRKCQDIVQSNVDWDATNERVWKDSQLEQPCETRRGLLRVKFKNPKGLTALVSRNSTIQLTYPATMTIDMALELLAIKLATPKGEKLWFKVERKVPLYDEAWSVFASYRRGHLAHRWPCLACVMEHVEADVWNRVNAVSNPNPVDFIQRYVESWFRNLAQTWQVHMEKQLLESVNKFEAVPLKGEG